MKKEWFAGICLIGLLVAVLLNFFVLKNLTGSLNELTDKALAEAENGNWDSAESLAEEAKNLWTSHDTYLRIVLRHSEVNETTVCLYSILENIEEKDAKETESSVKLLSLNVFRIMTGEEISLRSVM